VNNKPLGMPTTMSEAQERLRAGQATVSLPVGPKAPTDAQKPKRRQRSNTGPQDGDSAGRWATLNAFHDIVARHLTPAEQLVWGQLFRWCRDGKVSVSTRQIAAGCGIDKVTTTRALAKLKSAGLVWVVNLSRHKGTASVYGLHPHPDRCLGKCMAARPRSPR
jgi:hypothetical protein